MVTVPERTGGTIVAGRRASHSGVKTCSACSKAIFIATSQSLDPGTVATAEVTIYCIPVQSLPSLLDLISARRLNAT